MERDLKTLTILYRSVNAITNVIKTDVGQYGLNVTEFGVLEALYHKGTLSVQAIVDKVLIANSSMSYVLSKLEDKALIKKEKSSQDKRQFNISITSKGQSILDEMYPKHVQSLRQRLDVLTTKEENELQRLLKKVGKKAVC
jgi:MarR family 2-MHQ and catechol resistance regulon transcriptional repressor